MKRRDIGSESSRVRKKRESKPERTREMRNRINVQQRWPHCMSRLLSAIFMSPVYTHVRRAMLYLNDEPVAPSFSDCS